MSIYDLMRDEKARDIYVSLDQHIHPATLADNYLQAKLAGRGSECLALETYMRDMARIHFHRPEVRQALQDMEKHKARRKMGKGGTKMLKDIAARIRRDYAEGWYAHAGDGRIVFKIDSLKVTCKHSPGAVELVACKYERGAKSFQELPGGRRPLPHTLARRRGFFCLVVL
jgi:hypothetical protein